MILSHTYSYIVIFLIHLKKFLRLKKTRCIYGRLLEVKMCLHISQRQYVRVDDVTRWHMVGGSLPLGTQFISGGVSMLSGRGLCLRCRLWPISQDNA